MISRSELCMRLQCTDQMIISQKPEEIREALALLSKCELKRVTLRECHASTEAIKDAKGPFSLRVSHNSTANAILDGVLRVEVRFQIESYDAADPPGVIFSFQCSFALDYELEDRLFQPSAESITAFKDGNAVFNCWAYAREFFQSIASRMELAPPPLPLLRIIPQVQKKEDGESRPRATRRHVATPIESAAPTPE
jgi:hypothetical protein